MDVLAEHTVSLFTKCHGEKPRYLVAAPGRVNLIGEHTDYNDGFVLPMAIERYTVMAADRNGEKEITVNSETTGDTAGFSLRPPIERGSPRWSNYVRGVVAGFQQKGVKIPGFDAMVASSVPFGGGVSSSAALEVATATLLEAITGHSLEKIEKALLCQQAEHKFAGVPCGIMDQFTSVLAKKNHALLLDCRTREATPVRMTDPDVTVLVMNTNVRHQLMNGEYASRRSQCETAAKTLGVPALRDVTSKDIVAAKSRLDPTVFRRARHVVTENERTLQAARAIQAADWPLMGKLMYESHASLRDDYEVSCRELDVVVEGCRRLGVENGVFGCRMTGAGFGGCTVGLVKTGSVQLVTRKLAEYYEEQTAGHLGMFSTGPAGGARVLGT